MNNKRYYWIKLKTDFFNQETIDFLLQQENGCQYVVLYQMLCLQTANNNGIMATEIGEIIVPYDIKKIVRDTKYFDIDTVVVALDLFKKLGLIYEEENKTLRISNIIDMVGSEAANSNAQRQKRFRQRQKEQLKIETVTQTVTNSNGDIDIRDKSIENRYINNIYISEKEEKMPYKEIIEYLNEKANTKYRYTSENTKRHIRARINDGYTLDDFKYVIDIKTKEWLKTDMEKYLRPETLFGNKFENYVNQKKKMTKNELFESMKK